MTITEVKEVKDRTLDGYYKALDELFNRFRDYSHGTSYHEGEKDEHA